MDRRTFFQTTTLASIGAMILPASLLRSRLEVEIDYARRIIYVNKPPNSIETLDLYNFLQREWDHGIVGPFSNFMYPEKIKSGKWAQWEYKGLESMFNAKPPFIENAIEGKFDNYELPTGDRMAIYRFEEDLPYYRPKSKFPRS